MRESEQKYRTHFENISDTPEVIIDFSSRNALENTINICRKYSCGLILGSTGLSEPDMETLKNAAKSMPIVQSYNLSIGINILNMIIKEYKDYFKNWDVEMIEIHHKHKKDSPSGTAKMLQESFGRNMNIHSLRIGEIRGDHILILANGDEVIKISHSALSRNLFAEGARVAMDFISSATNGLYSFEEVLKWTQTL